MSFIDGFIALQTWVLIQMSMLYFSLSLCHQYLMVEVEVSPRPRGPVEDASGLQPGSLRDEFANWSVWEALNTERWRSGRTVEYIDRRRGPTRPGSPQGSLVPQQHTRTNQTITAIPRGQHRTTPHESIESAAVGVSCASIIGRPRSLRRAWFGAMVAMRGRVATSSLLIGTSTFPGEQARGVVWCRQQNGLCHDKEWGVWSQVWLVSRAMELPAGSNAVIGRTQVTARPARQNRYSQSQSPPPSGHGAQQLALASMPMPGFMDQLGFHGSGGMMQMFLAQQQAMNEMLRNGPQQSAQQQFIGRPQPASQTPVPIQILQPTQPPVAPNPNPTPPLAQPEPGSQAADPRQQIHAIQQDEPMPPPAAQTGQRPAGDRQTTTDPASFEEWQQQQAARIHAATEAEAAAANPTVDSNPKPRWSTKEGRLGRPKLWCPDDCWEGCSGGRTRLKGRLAGYAQLRYDWAAAYIQNFPESDVVAATAPLDEQTQTTARLLVVAMSALEAQTLHKDEGVALVVKARPALRGTLLSMLCRLG